MTRTSGDLSPRSTLVGGMGCGSLSRKLLRGHMQTSREGGILARLTKQNSCWPQAGVIYRKGGEREIRLDLESNHTSVNSGRLLSELTEQDSCERMSLDSSGTDTKAQEWGLVENRAQRSIKIWPRQVFVFFSLVVFDYKDEQS